MVQSGLKAIATLGFLHNSHIHETRKDAICLRKDAICLRKDAICLKRIQVGVSTPTPRSIAGTRLFPGLLRPGTRSYIFRFASLSHSPNSIIVLLNPPAPADHKTLLMISNIPSRWDSICVCWSLWLSKIPSRWDSGRICWSFFSI